MRKVYLTRNELNMFKTVCSLIESNIINDSKKNISCYQISKDMGLSYNGVRKILKRIKDI